VALLALWASLIAGATLLTQRPIRLAEKVFDAALTAAGFSFVLSAASRVALLVVRRRRLSADTSRA
jgi:hypothetical protein